MQCIDACRWVDDVACWCRMLLMLFHYFLLSSLPWFTSDDGNIDALFYMLMFFTQICQQVQTTVYILWFMHHKYRTRSTEKVFFLNIKASMVVTFETEIFVTTSAVSGYLFFAVVYVLFSWLWARCLWCYRHFSASLPTDELVPRTALCCTAAVISVSLNNTFSSLLTFYCIRKTAGDERLSPWCVVTFTGIELPHIKLCFISKL